LAAVKSEQRNKEIKKEIITVKTANGNSDLVRIPHIAGLLLALTSVLVGPCLKERGAPLTLFQEGWGGGKRWVTHVSGLTIRGLLGSSFEGGRDPGSRLLTISITSPPSPSQGTSATTITDRTHKPTPPA
jgi:hypothetical protein